QEVPGVSRNVAKKVKVEDAQAERESDLYEEGVHFAAPDEMKQILQYARDELPRSDKRWFPLIATFIFTGARSGELKALYWERDIHFDTGWIDIRYAVDHFGNEGPTKTKSSRRRVPFLDPLAGILNWWMFECPREGRRFPTGEGKARLIAQLLKLN